MKVYGWLEHLYGEKHAIRKDPVFQAHHNQVRAIVAAKSKAEVARITGVKRPSQLFNLAETGNAREIEIAMRSPGIVFITLDLRRVANYYRYTTETGAYYTGPPET